MRLFFCWMLLFFVVGVRGQELPFEVEVEDLNLEAYPEPIRTYTSDNRMYVKTARGCLYGSSSSGKAFTQLDCGVSDYYRSIFTNGSGIFTQNWSAADSLYYLNHYGSDNKAYEVLASKRAITGLAWMPSGNMLISADNKVYSLDASSRNLTTIIDTFEVYGYLQAKEFETASLLYIGHRKLYLTDGTGGGTHEIVVDSADWNISNAKEFAGNIFIENFKDGNLWRIDLQDSGSATMFFNPEKVGEEGSDLLEFFIGRDRVVAMVYDRKIRQEYLYGIKDGEAIPVIRPSTGTKYGLAKIYHAGDGLAIFTGSHGIEHGMYVTDGTSDGTRQIVDWKYRDDFRWWEVRSFDRLSDDLFVFVAKEWWVDDPVDRLLLIDVSTNDMKDLGLVDTENYRWRKVVIDDDYIFSTGDESYILDKANLELAPYNQDLSSIFNEEIDFEFTYFIDRNSGHAIDEVIAIGHESAIKYSYQLPISPEGEVSYVERLFTFQDRVYAVAKTDANKFYLYLLNGSGQSIRYVSELPSDPLGSDIQAFFEGNQGELFISTSDTIYQYDGGRVNALGSPGWHGTPNQYVGRLDGVDIFGEYGSLLMPALNKQVQLTRSAHVPWTNVSNYVLTDANYYALSYLRTAEDSSAVAILHSGNLATSETLDTVDIYNVPEYREGYRPMLEKFQDKLYYAIPTYQNEKHSATWYAYDLHSLSSRPADEFSLVNHAGGRIDVFENHLYFVSNKGGLTELMRLNDDLKVETVASLEDGEELVDVMTWGETTLVMTDLKIIDLHQNSTLITPPADKTFEQMKDVGGELFVEISDENGLGFYSYRRQSHQLVPLATGFNSRYRREQYRESKSNAVIGNNILFRGIRNGIYHFMLYNAKREALYNLGRMDDNYFNGLNGPLAMAHAGRYYYTFLHPELGLELHHFRPPFTHTLSGTVRNQAGQPLAGRRVEATGQQGVTSFTDSLGNYTLYLNAEQEYTVRVSADDCYENSEAHNVTTDGGENTDLTHNFSITGTGSGTDLSPYLASGPARCGFTVPFWLSLNNTGCSDQDGELILELHDEVTYISTDAEPVDFDEHDNRLRWTFADLTPGRHQQIGLQLKMPSEDLAGEPIPMNAISVTTDVDGTEVRDTFRYDDMLRCAIDPNDKRAFPRRTDAGYVQFDEELTYMIRFQNTGNDTAFTVRLEDRLSDSLDLSTFTPVSSSHDYDISMGEGGLLEVIYRDIMLVDSLTNEPASHGYFTFKIKLKEGYDDFSEVRNTAGIYFDFNRPVITNTTKNTFVEALDADADGYMFFEECNDQNAAINPAAPDIPGNGVDENCDGQDGTVAVREFGGGAVTLAPNPAQNMTVLEVTQPGNYTYTLYDLRGRRLTRERFRDRVRIDLIGLASGTYLLHLTDGEGGQVTRRVVRR